jgi:hypothetical protein
MSEEILPPHLKISSTVTEEEYAKARWQSRVVLFPALLLGVAIAAGLILLGTQGIISLGAGGFCAIGCERLLDRVFAEGKKMRTQRMKLYPQLRDYRKRQGG